MKTLVRRRVELSPTDIKDTIMWRLRHFDKPAPSGRESDETFTLTEHGAVLEWNEEIFD
jgi:hypothetical protein